MKYEKKMFTIGLLSFALLGTTALAHAADPVDGYGNALPTPETTGFNYTYTDTDVDPSNPYYTFSGMNQDGKNTYTLKGPLSDLASGPVVVYDRNYDASGNLILNFADFDVGQWAPGYSSSYVGSEPTLRIYEGNSLEKNSMGTASIFVNSGANTSLVFCKNYAVGVDITNSDGGKMYVDYNVLDSGTVTNANGGNAYINNNSAISAMVTNNGNSYMRLDGNVASYSTIENANGAADDASIMYLTHNQANDATVHNYNSGQMFLYGNNLNSGTFINDADATMIVGDCSIALGCQDTRGTDVSNGVITNNGTLNASGTVTFTDATLTSNGVANLNGLHLIGGDFIMNGTVNTIGAMHFDNVQIVVNGPFNATDSVMDITGSLAGSGGVNFQNSTVNFASDGSAFTGTVDSVDSTFNFLNDSKIGGTVNIGSNSTLNGYGTLGDLNILDGGTLSPSTGSSFIGQINVDGNLTFAAGSTYNVDFSANPVSSDLVSVAGTTTITGGTVAVNSLSPITSYNQTVKQAIISSTGGVSGQFDNTTINSTFLGAELSYDDNNVYLSVSKNKSFASVAYTRNQRNTANALDGLMQAGSSLSLYNKLLVLDADSARYAFDQLSGEAYASANGVLLEESSFVRDAVFNRLSQAQGVISNVNDATVVTKADGNSLLGNEIVAWGNAYGAWSRRNSDGNAHSMKSTTGGFFTGVDAAVFGDWRMGVLAGYSRTNFHAKNVSSSGNSDNYTLGLYAGTPFEISNQKFNFRSGLSYTWHQVDMKRSIAFQDFSDRTGADYDASTFQVFGELGYEIKTANAIIEPYANVAYVRFHNDAFNEHGATAAKLSVKSDTMDTAISTLGVRASTTFKLGQTMTTARVNVGWRHAYNDITPKMTSAFVGSNSFDVYGVPLAQDTFTIDTGLNFNVWKNTNLDISYFGKFGDGTSQNGAKAALVLKF